MKVVIKCKHFIVKLAEFWNCALGMLCVEKMSLFMVSLRQYLKI